MTLQRGKAIKMAPARLNRNIPVRTVNWPLAGSLNLAFAIVSQVRATVSHCKQHGIHLSSNSLQDWKSLDEEKGRQLGRNLQIKRSEIKLVPCQRL